MSGSVKCLCGRKRGDYTDLIVLDRNCHHSAFSGYKETYSDYSVVKCRRFIDTFPCPGFWRTKAKYVDELPSGYVDHNGVVCSD